MSVRESLTCGCYVNGGGPCPAHAVGRIEQLTTTPPPQQVVYYHVECPGCVSLRAERDALKRENAEAKAVLDATMRALTGGETSDFEQSFAVVREALEARAEGRLSGLRDAGEAAEVVRCAATPSGLTVAERAVFSRGYYQGVADAVAAIEQLAGATPEGGQG